MHIMRLLAALLAQGSPQLSTPTAQLSRAATFWRYATPVVAKLPLRQLASIPNCRSGSRARASSDEECAIAWEDAHVSGASAFRKPVDDSGGFYVKDRGRSPPSPPGSVSKAVFRMRWRA